VSEYEVKALVEDYRRMWTHVVDFARLQYQLVGVAYAIAGTALALWGSRKPEEQPPPTFSLFFPPIFCAIAVVQLYLHSSIKSFARYINFRLRPRMEAIVSDGLPQSARNTIWTWEEYYVQSHGLLRWIIRQFGSVIIVLALLPAAGALAFFLLLVFRFPSTFKADWTDWALFIFDAGAIGLTFVLFVFVKAINEYWWIVEKRETAKQELANCAET